MQYRITETAHVSTPGRALKTRGLQPPDDPKIDQSPKPKSPVQVIHPRAEIVQNDDVAGPPRRPFAFCAELAGCKQLFLRGQHRRKLCQNADEPDNQAEEYDFFQWMSPADLDSTRLFQTRHRESVGGDWRLKNHAFRIRETLIISCSYTATAGLN